MRKILILFSGILLSLAISLSFESSAYATEQGSGGNATGDGTGGDGIYTNIEGGVSEYASGWILYVVDEDGNNKTGTKLWYSYQLPTTDQLEGAYALNIDVKTRIGGLDTALITNAKTNAPWGPPVWSNPSGAYATGDGNQARGSIVKNWFTSEDHLTNIITELWGESFTKEFVDNEYILVLEPIYWFQWHDKQNGVYTPLGVYSYGTARGLAESMKTYPNIFGTNGCALFGRYTNDYFANCCKFEFNQLGLTAPTKSGRLTHDEILASAYGIMTVWASEAGTGTPPTPPGEEDTPSPSTADFEVYTYNYSNQFNLDKNNSPAGRIPSGETLTNGVWVDSWRTHFIPNTKSGSGTFTAKYKIEIVETSSKQVPISAGRWDEFKNRYPNLRVVNGYLYNGSKQLTETKTTTSYHYDYYTASTTKSYSYYYLPGGLGAVDVWDFSYAEITSNCFPKTVTHKDNETFKDYSYTAGRGVIQTPVSRTDTILIKNCSSKEQGEAAARNRVSSDVGNYVTEGDKLVVNGVTFMNGTSWVNPKDYNYPKTELEVDVTIPFNVKNGHYPTSGKFYYKNYTKNTTNYKIKDASKTTIEERIRPGYTQNEPVFVHTPVVSPVTLHNTEKETQLVPAKVNSDYVDYQLILEHTYSFTFDMGKHLDLQGYSHGGSVGDFSKYVRKAEVSFPFDVAIVTNPSGSNEYAYYKANEWIEVNYREETFFYIPTYAMETDYSEIYFRVWAYNSEGENAEEALANTGHTNYIAYYKTAIQLSGIIYNFQVVGIEDEYLTDSYMNDDSETTYYKKMFAYCPVKEERKWGNLNRVGTSWLRYTIDGTITNAWNPRYVLPYSNFKGKIAGQWDYSDYVMATGTTFAFSVDTIANLWDEGIDSIEITPSFRYVDKDGNVDTDILVYTTSVTGNYIPWNSENEETYSVTMTNEAFTDSYTNAQMEYTMQKYNEAKNTHYTYIGNFMLETRKMENSYTPSKITLNSDLRLLTGNVEELEKNLAREGEGLIQLDDDATIPLDDDTKDRFNYSMQTWYGMYTIPTNKSLFIIRRKDLEGYTDMDDDGDVDLYDYMYSQEIGGIAGGGQDDIFQHEGYIVLNFDIVTKNNGEEHLTYHGGALNMCKTQGMEEQVYISDPKNHNPYETLIDVESGDVAIIDLSENLQTRKYRVGIMIIN